MLTVENESPKYVHPSGIGLRIWGSNHVLELLVKPEQDSMKPSAFRNPKAATANERVKVGFGIQNLTVIAAE
jgi:hypothetical protein